jgi:hypothetical protein
MSAPPCPSSDTINQSASLDGRDAPTTRTASFPFDDPKADFIIRSSDNIHFYTHKSLLSIVSPVFEGMLEVLDGSSQELYDDRPCLLVTDDSRHLLCLLSWCDPRSKELKPTLDNLTMMLSIAKKYGVDFMFKKAQKDLLARCSAVESFRVYAIAIRFRLDDVVQKAARATLQSSSACQNSPDLKHISGLAIQNLHNYHFECKAAVRDLLASESWAENMKVAARQLSSRRDIDSENPWHSHGVEYFSLRRLAIMGGGVLWLSTGKTAPWWSSYVEVMINDWPSVLVLPPPSWLEWLEDKMISRDKCSQCRKYGYERLKRVSQYLVNIIDKTVSEVRKPLVSYDSCLVTKLIWLAKF